MRKLYSVIIAIAMLVSMAVIVDVYYMDISKGDTNEHIGNDTTTDEEVIIEYEGLKYTLYSDTNNAVVSGVEDGSTQTTITIPENITYLDVVYTVDTIGEGAFRSNTTITSINAPYITTVGDGAFRSCTSLTSVSFPVCTTIGDSAFDNCGKLTSVSFPLVTYIGDNAFSYCDLLTSVEFPLVTSIEWYTFEKCVSLTSVSFPLVTSIGMSAFENCSSLGNVYLPSGCTTIEENAFLDSSAILNITLTTGTAYSWTSPFGSDTPFAIFKVNQDLITNTDLSQYITPTLTGSPTLSLSGKAATGLSIGTDGVLSGASTQAGNLVITSTNPRSTYPGTIKYTIPVSQGEEELFTYSYVTADKTAVITGVSSTVSGAVEIPETTVYQGVTYKVIAITNDAFRGNTAITSINAPYITSIQGDNAFNRCTSLTSVSFPLVTRIGVSTFEDCTSLTSVNIPKCITIGDNAFDNCGKLTSVEFPKCTSIGDFAFMFCVKLTSVSFPLVTSIGSGAFNNCDLLTSVEIPLVTSIGMGAFEYCSSLTAIDLPNIITLGENMFNKCTALKTINLGAKVTTIGANLISAGMTVTITMSSVGSTSPWVDASLPYAPFCIYTSANTICMGMDVGNITVTSYGTGSATATYSLSGDASSGLTIGSDGHLSGVISHTGVLTITETVTGSSGSVTLVWNITIDQVIVDNVIYAPDLTNMTAQVIGCVEGVTSITIPYYIEYGGYTLVITSLATAVFMENMNLVSVTIGTNGTSKITAIPDQAFEGCLRLETLVLPDTITTIGASAFYECGVALKTLPSSLVSIDDYAFFSCTDLTLTTLPTGVVSIGKYAFQCCSKLALTSLPSGLGYIDDCSFGQCPKLKLTSLPNGVTTIGEYAFQGCTGIVLKSLNNVATIGKGAFDGCTGLNVSYDLSKVRTIGEYAFNGCTGLSGKTLDLSSVSTVGERAFVNTTGITFKVPLTGITIGEMALGVAYYQYDKEILAGSDVLISAQGPTALSTFTIKGTGSDGLTVDDKGTIMGTANMIGSFTVTAKASNTSVASFLVKSETILPFTLSSDTLYCVSGMAIPFSEADTVYIDSTVSSAYTVTWSVSDGASGVKVVDGVIQGTAGAVGTYHITITRTVTGYGLTQTDTAELTVVIVGVLTITSTAKDIIPVPDPKPDPKPDTDTKN